VAWSSKSFQDMTLCWSVNSYQWFEGAYCLRLHGLSIHFCQTTQTLKMEAVYSFQTSVTIYRTAKRYVLQRYKDEPTSAREIVLKLFQQLTEIQKLLSPWGKNGRHIEACTCCSCNPVSNVQLSK
jgi:hypothetical protein